MSIRAMPAPMLGARSHVGIRARQSIAESMFDLQAFDANHGIFGVQPP